MIEEPLLRLASLDLGAAADITNLAEVFDFAKDYLGLLKAAVIAAGLVPPGIEGSGQSLAELLARLAGGAAAWRSSASVNNIPKGSRLAVSTTLPAALVSVCMWPLGRPPRSRGRCRSTNAGWCWRGRCWENGSAAPAAAVPRAASGRG